MLHLYRLGFILGNAEVGTPLDCCGVHGSGVATLQRSGILDDIAVDVSNLCLSRRQERRRAVRGRFGAMPTR